MTGRSPSATSSSRPARAQGAAPVQDRILAGFAGGTADAFALRTFRVKLEKHQGSLLRSAVELAKGLAQRPRVAQAGSDAGGRRPRLLMIITGNGDVLEPEQGIVAIGSGGAFAQSAARALIENTELAPVDVVRKSLEIAGDLCIYTNRNFTLETLD